MRSVMFLLLATACMPKLQAENEALQARVAELESELREAKIALETNNPEIAKRLMAESREAYATLDVETARQRASEVIDTHGETPMATSAKRFLQRTQIIGESVPALEVAYWYTAQTHDWTTGTTVVLFFEPWCPHCKNAMPGMMALSSEWADRGVQFMALTRASRDTSDEAMQAFIDEYGLAIPVARDEPKRMTDALGVSGVPEALVIRDGVLVWREHPARFTSEVLERLTAER